MTKSSTPTILITGATGNIGRKLAKSVDDFARYYAPDSARGSRACTLRPSRRPHLETFTHDMTEHSFLQQIESDYQLSLFDEHVTATPTLYLNDVRYTGPTDLDSFLRAIKLSDTQDRIRVDGGVCVRGAVSD